jgi:hypothetical protein
MPGEPSRWIPPPLITTGESFSSIAMSSGLVGGSGGMEPWIAACSCSCKSWFCGTITAIWSWVSCRLFARMQFLFTSFIFFESLHLKCVLPNCGIQLVGQITHGMREVRLPRGAATVCIVHILNLVTECHLQSFVVAHHVYTITSLFVLQVCVPPLVDS